MIDALGWLVAALGCSISLPQLFRLLRTRSVAGVPLTTWQLTLGVNLAWTSHGVVVGHVNLWLPNLVLAVWTMMILAMFHRYAGAPWLRLVVPGAALAVVTTTVDLVVGAVAFAVVALVPSVLSMTSQLLALVRSAELTAVSESYFVINLVNQVLWLVWAVLTGEQSVIIASSLIGTLWLVNLVWLGLRRAGLVHPIRPLGEALVDHIPVVAGIPDGSPEIDQGWAVPEMT